ncbi:MAG: PadR family transcriptional regulator [Clostridia bacterium]|nr:PadR family transcriptional regulator [Clostridia bacterium]
MLIRKNGDFTFSLFTLHYFLRFYIKLSESTLYTILKRLEIANMLTVRTAEHGGRLRKYYRITSEGLKRIEDFKDEWKEILSIYRFVTKEDNGNE